MEEEYDIDCPICGDVVTVSIGEGRTIYYIEGHENTNSLYTLWGSNDPEETKGTNEVIDERFMEIESRDCEERHQVNIYHAHYTNIRSEHQMYGPAEKPQIYCPQCSYRLDTHEDHIVRLDTELSMQYVLRSVSLSESSTHKLVKAITKTIARKYNQICVQNQCPHCSEIVYYNYSSRKINESEGYEGVKNY